MYNTPLTTVTTTSLSNSSIVVHLSFCLTEGELKPRKVIETLTKITANGWHADEPYGCVNTRYKHVLSAWKPRVNPVRSQKSFITIVLNKDGLCSLRGCFFWPSQMFYCFLSSKDRIFWRDELWEKCHNKLFQKACSDCKEQPNFLYERPHIATGGRLVVQPTYKNSPHKCR